MNLTSKEYHDVLPSGVPFSLRKLRGEDQDTLMLEKNLRDGSGFSKMLADCFLSLGDEKAVTENHIDRLLETDRKYAMVRLRQHSLNFNPLFEFAYEWPMQNKTKHRETFEVNFTDEHFKAVPCKWVRLEMERAEKAFKTDNPEMPYVKPPKFPVMYTHYADMLAAQKTVELTFPECGAAFKFELLTNEMKKKWAGVEEIKTTQILGMREPKLILQEKGKTETTYMGVNVPGLDLMDVEFFRKNVFDYEGRIDTTLVIQSKAHGRTARVDLIAVPDFFFPSMAS